MHPNETVDYWRGHINGLIVDQYRDKLKGNVADFGSGKGFMSAILAEFTSIKTVTAIDIVEPSIELPNKVKFQKGDLTKLKVPKTKFDAAVTFHTLEHIKDVGKAIEIIAKQIKVGGYLIVSVPFMGAYWNETHVQQFNLDTLRSYFETGSVVKGKKTKLFTTVELYHDTRIDDHGNQHDCITGLFKRGQ